MIKVIPLAMECYLSAYRFVDRSAPDIGSMSNLLPDSLAVRFTRFCIISVHFLGSTKYQQLKIFFE